MLNTFPQVFLAVSCEQHAVVGCLVAEAVPIKHVMPHQAARAVAPHGPATWCGINRIWVKASHRRRGIATGLLDCARDYLTFGYRFERDQVVFSQPTTTGRLLAEHYIGSQAVPVYDAART